MAIHCHGQNSIWPIDQKGTDQCWGEFKSQEFTIFLQELGINILTSIPHMHQQNGCAERFIHTVMDNAQAMCLDACLPQNLWVVLRQLQL